jgi:hypothetical protein
MLTTLFLARIEPFFSKSNVAADWKLLVLPNAMEVMTLKFACLIKIDIIALNILAIIYCCLSPILLKTTLHMLQDV